MKAYCLLNHTLTDNQIKELETKYDCAQIIYPDEDLKNIWSQIPPTEKLDMTVIDKVTQWLMSAKQFDVLIIQGEFGSTFMLVDYALKNQIIPLYAVSKRISQEVSNGESVTRNTVFRHVCFREYKYYQS
ncbi:MAG: hypothetical protein IKQ61_05180 [Spirochaetales bacterium]|nr:hypothetical protein [Spirochaetales bacterium]MBR6199639.1 hypothetical protein [Spirochaetales bacterium]